jgi:hypothetical protein
VRHRITSSRREVLDKRLFPSRSHGGDRTVVTRSVTAFAVKASY